MDQSQSYALLLAIVVPFVAGLLTRASWPSWLRFVVVLVLSGLVGAGTLYYTGALSFTADNYLITVAAIVGVSQTTYAILIKATGLKPTIDKLINHD